MNVAKTVTIRGRGPLPDGPDRAYTRRTADSLEGTSRAVAIASRGPSREA